MFSFETDYNLKNDRVELSPLHESHIDLLFPEANKESIWKYFTENGKGKENFRKYMISALQKKNDKKEYPFVIKELKSFTYVGMTRIYDVYNDLKNVKIGHTWIGEQFQGTGINKHCKYVLFKFLFDHVNMKRIGFGADSGNIKSIKAMESVGCIREGVLRSFLPTQGSSKRNDIVLLSIIYQEWNDKIRQELKQKIESSTVIISKA